MRCSLAILIAVLIHAQSLAAFESPESGDGGTVLSDMPLDDLIALLGDEEVDGSILVAALSRHGLEAVPLLTASLASPDDDTYQQAIEALVAIAGEYPVSAPGIVADLAALVHGEETRAWQAASALGDIGPAAGAATPVLVAVATGLETTAGDDRIVLSFYLRALGGIGGDDAGGIALIMRWIGDEGIGDSARDALVGYGDAALPALAEALSDERRGAALMAIAVLGDQAQTLASAVATHLTSADPLVRALAMRAYAEIGDDAATLRAAILAALDDRDAAPRKEGLVLAPGFPADAGTFIDHIIPAIDDGDAQIRCSAVVAASALASGEDRSLLRFVDQPALPVDDARRDLVVAALTRHLVDDDQGVQLAVVNGLGRIGHGDDALRAQVLRVMVEGPPDVGYACVCAFRGIGFGPAQAEPLVAALGHPLARVRCNAAQVAGDSGATDPRVLAALATCLDDDDSGVRCQAAAACERIGQAALPLIEPLIRHLDDPYGIPTGNVRAALSRLGVGAAPRLRELLREGRHRAAALQALAPLGSEALQPALPDILIALVADDVDIRAQARHAVAAIGPAAATAAWPALLAVSLAHGAPAERYEAIAAGLRLHVAEAGTLAVALEPGDDYRIDDIWKASWHDPELALALLERQPAVVESLWTLDALFVSPDPALDRVRAATLASPRIDLRLVARHGGPQHRAAIAARLAAASPHGRHRLAACLRALGDAPDRVFAVDATRPAGPRPLSATRSGDGARRVSGRRDIGCSFDGTPIIVTGVLRRGDGSIPAVVRFIDSGGWHRFDPGSIDEAAIRYDAAAGRFVYTGEVFSSGMDDTGDGPYRTGSALVALEAEGCAPLTVRFFDEMPDLTITLPAP